ncbi:MAG: glycine cleavage system protein H [Candidatus Hodarchaeales archaeon]
MGDSALEIKTEKKVYYFPLDRYYYTHEPGHIWLKPEGDLFTVGFDDFGQFQGPILHIRTRPIGKTFPQGKAFGTVETNKFIGQLRLPLSSTLEEVNNEVINQPQLINEDPYHHWIAKIRPTNLDEEIPSDFIIEIGDRKKLREYIILELNKYDDPPI